MMDFETVICVAPKDTNKIPYVLARLEQFTDTTGIRIISPVDNIPIGNCRLPVQFYHDNDVLQFDRGRFRYRPNWVMQQFLKLFQNVTETDWYLVIDSDTMINTPLNFFAPKPVFMFGLDTYSEPHFIFSSKMVGVGKVHKHSFLSELTLYNKQLIQEMIADYRDVLHFMESAAKIIDNDCFPAESELYGNWIEAYSPGLYQHRYLNSVLGGLYNCSYTNEAIESRVAEVGKPNVDVFSIHSWWDV